MAGPAIDPRVRRDRTGTAGPTDPTAAVGDDDVDGDGDDLAGGIESEVTRVEAVEYLEGASGHGVASLLFLAGGCYFLVTAEPAIAWACIAVAALLTANGVSIYAWDTLRERFRSTWERPDDRSGRTLQPHRLSKETTAELKAGFVMVGAFVAVVLVGLGVLRLFDPRILGYLFVAGLVVANAAALVWTVYAPRRREGT